MTDLTLEHGMPANLDAEKSVLGSVLLDNPASEDVFGQLRKDDFSISSHETIFRCMADLARAGRKIDIVTLSNYLNEKRQIESIGGVAYLAGLTEGLPRRLNIAEYVRIVREKSLLRRTMTICSNAIAQAADNQNAEQVVSGCIRDLEDELMSRSQESDLESVGQWLANNDMFAQRDPGLMTGFAEYDDLTGGLYPGEQTVICARPSMGKTAFSACLVLNVSYRGLGVAVFVNEQNKRAFMIRMLCAKTGVPLMSFRRGEFSHIERHYIQDALQEFKTLPIFWDDRSSMSLAGIRAKAKRLKRDDDLKLIVIDQLNHISAEGILTSGRRGDEIIGDKVKGTRMIAKDLDVPLVLMHQLNRDTTKNVGSRPTLANIADSGKIEQHATNLAFLHRPEYYEKDDPNLKGKGEIIVAKCTDGPTGTAHCLFDGYCARWKDKEN